MMTMASSTIDEKLIQKDGDGGDGMDLSDEDSEDMFVGGDDEAAGERKRLDSNKKEKEKEEQKVVDPILLEHAKKRLSKWAARLFDPDRPKGLVEPPQTIPLNDEFLSAFGKRERDYDKQMGREIEVDQTIESDDNDDDDDDDDDEKRRRQQQQKKNQKNSEKEEERTKSKQQQQTKVKISNLAYRTTQEKVTEECQKFGPLVEVNLILDKEREGKPGVHNSGYGYVTFEHEEDAKACIDGLGELDGRQLRTSLAKEKAKSSSSSSGGGSKSGSKNMNHRYWEKDISTVCFNCGQVGHIGANCMNPAKAKPCPLCAGLDHEQWGCPCNRICFNCGIPGHVNRMCTYRRGMPRRMVCGICFTQGHHRLQCRAAPSYAQNAPAIQDATCMDCGRKGHFSCQEMRWFYGLQGLSCFNCGSQGHTGYDCRRPNVFQCYNDTEVTTQEIERATAEST